MHGRILVLVGTLLAATLLGGAAIDAAQTSPTHVNIDNFAFPEQITVTPGTEVIWSNHDDIPHTVTDADEPRGFKSSPLDTGDTFSHMFATAGTYRYFCSLHPHMQGTVVVK